jgi:hypothetical protein
MLAVPLWASGARAQVRLGPSPAPLNTALSLEAPDDAGCGTADALRDDVERRVGEPVFTDQTRATRLLVVHIVRDDQGFHATLQVGTAGSSAIGERAVHSDAASCSEITRALAVVITTYVGVRAPASATFEEPTEPPTELPTAQPAQRIATVLRWAGCWDGASCHRPLWRSPRRSRPRRACGR